MDIKVEFSTDSLFGYTDEEEYDVSASVTNFEKSLGAALYDEYLDANVVIINNDNDRVSVDGMYDHNECPWINNIVNKVWESWEWLER